MLMTIHSKSFRSNQLTPLVEAETEWMARYFPEVIAARWSFEIDHGEIIARCELHASCGYFFGDGRSVELASAVTQAADKAVRWRRRVKRIAQRRRRYPWRARLATRRGTV